MANIPLFVSDNSIIYDMAGNRLGVSLPLMDVANYLGSIDVNLTPGTVFQFREVGYNYPYKYYEFVNGVLEEQ